MRAALHTAIPAIARRDVYAGSSLDAAAFAALPPTERSGLTAVIGLSNHLQVALPLENRTQALAHELVVVDQQDANAHAGLLSRIGSGTRIVMRLPLPSEPEPNVMVPPS